MLTAAKLHAVLDGLDPESPVIVRIINGPRFNAAYAEQQMCGGALTAYLGCYEDPLPGKAPIPAGEGTATLAYEPWAANTNLELAVLVRKTTVNALQEHSSNEVKGSLPINETEVLILLTADTVRALLERARLEDTRIDDVIMRLAL